MSYKLLFLPSAFKEWKKLGSTIREQFKKKLSERISNPIVPGDRLTGQKNYYKIIVNYEHIVTGGMLIVNIRITGLYFNAGFIGYCG